jgi:hypothetical protein
LDYVLKRYVKYSPNSALAAYDLPAIFTSTGVLISHLRFLYSKRNKSQSWQERNTFAIEQLLKFINSQSFIATSVTEVLNAFVDALSFGTVNEFQIDETGLFWKPRRIEDINVLLGHINQYCDYIDQLYGFELPKLNPMRRATKAEERLRWCAYYRRTRNCFLNHLSNPKDQNFSYSREVITQSNPMISMESVNRFPASYFDTFIKEGFIKACNGEFQLDHASILIVMLMHYGGLRLSECFHIYVHDISIDTKTGHSLIKVFHPSDGKSPDPLFSTRKEYLNARYRLRPRNDYPRSHRLYSGWKNPLLTSKSLNFEVIFCPPEKAYDFSLLLQRYLNTRVDGEHPFLFSLKNGSAESKKNFIQKYGRAVNRIGLSSSKLSGTSPHAHRHSYGYRLDQFGLSRFEIQKAMHHKSPDSCLVYTKPSDSEVREKLRKVIL